MGWQCIERGDNTFYCFYNNTMKWYYILSFSCQQTVICQNILHHLYIVTSQKEKFVETQISMKQTELTSYREWKKEKNIFSYPGCFRYFYCLLFEEDDAMLFWDFILRSQFIIESIQVIGTETKKFSNKQLQSYSFQKWSRV